MTILNTVDVWAFPAEPAAQVYSLAVKHSLSGSLYATLLNNKWESFITPDTTRLNMICGVTVYASILQVHIPHCLIQVHSIYSTSLSLSSFCLSIRIYTLVRIVNVEKRRDSARGNRYLVELLLMEGGRRVVRLSDYIYLLLHRSRLEEGIESREGTMPSSHHTPSKTPLPSSSSTQTHNTTLWSTSWAKPLLCQPAMLEWRHDVMIHFVVPGIYNEYEFLFIRVQYSTDFVNINDYLNYSHNLTHYFSKVYAWWDFFFFF